MSRAQSTSSPLSTHATLESSFLFLLYCKSSTPRRATQLWSCKSSKQAHGRITRFLVSLLLWPIGVVFIFNWLKNWYHSCKSEGAIVRHQSKVIGCLLGMWPSTLLTPFKRVHICSRRRGNEFGYEPLGHFTARRQVSMCSEQAKSFQNHTIMFPVNDVSINNGRDNFEYLSLGCSSSSLGRLSKCHISKPLGWTYLGIVCAV